MATDENNKAIINVNNTSYNIQNDWLEVMRKYFKIEPDDAEGIHFLKSGLFGYNTEIFSNEIKNNVFHRNIIYDEHFLNTASFPESIYNFAKTFNYEVDMARPSQVRINFAIKKKDLVNNKFRREVKTEMGNIVSNRKTFELVIDNDFVFMMDNIQFRLPYPVKVVFKETEDKEDFTLVATYETDIDFPYMNLTNNYIKLWQDMVNGEKVVFFGLDLFQVQKTEKEFNVVSEDITDNLYYDVGYENQLSFFNVFYEYNGKRELLKKYFNNTFIPESDEKFCYFSLLDDDTLQISFSSTSNSFRPRLNSKLIIETYTTLGTGGNFSYMGNNINVNFNNNGEFDKVPVSVIPITECEGGMDRPSFTEVKNGIINNFAVRDNLIIDNDLEVFFDHINKTENLNGSDIEFIKKRNDIIKRIFNAYLITRDSERKVIPSNTAPSLEVSKSYLQANNWCIKENTPILYNNETKKYIVQTDLIKDVMLNGKPNPKYLQYSSPFLLKIEEKPVLIGNYHSTYTDNRIDMKYTYINPHINDNFQVKELSLNKSNINDTKYTLSMQLNTTYNINESNNILVRIILFDISNKPYGFFDLNAPNPNSFYYEGYLETDNLIHNNKITLIDSLYNVKGKATGKDILPTVLIDNQIKMEVGILVKSDNTNEKHGSFKFMQDLDGYTSALVFSNESDIPLFKNLYNYMESDVTPPKTGETFIIKQFPLIEREYFKHSFFNFFNVWNVYLDIIKNNIDKLENNTSVDIKLTNTYGPSRFYYYDTELGSDGNTKYKYIDNVHIGLNLSIALNYYLDTETDLAIKKYISDFIESCNTEKLFPISNLIRLLETEFDIIKYIEFFEIGGHNTQKIRSTYTSLLDMSKQEVEDYVPEYLNVEKKLDLPKVIDNNLLVGYPYNYNINITYK